MKHILITTIAAVVLVGCSESGELNQLAEEVETVSNKKNESVHESVIKGDIQAINEFLDNGGDVHLPNHKGYTMLHEAAFEGKVEIGKLLISRGADVDSSDGIGFTVLHAAAAFGHEEFVKLLLDNDVDTNVKIEAGPLDGKTPYDAAISGANGQRNQQIADLLRKHGGKTGAELKGGEPVVEAAQSETLSAKAPDISINDAAKAGNIEAVKQHLATGADVNAKGNGERTPLHYAATKEITELLIANGADVNAKDNLEFTPLHLAAEDGHKETAESLIAAGADVNAKNVLGGTPLLHLAAGHGQPEIVKLLTAKGADVNARNSIGGTPLHYTALRGRKEIAELLIAKGADVNAKDEEGETPLDWADGEIADLLRKHGGKTGEELKAEGK
jgi:cytohesin